MNDVPFKIRQLKLTPCKTGILYFTQLGQIIVGISTNFEVFGQIVFHTSILQGLA